MGIIKGFLFLQSWRGVIVSLRVARCAHLFKKVCVKYNNTQPKEKVFLKGVHTLTP
jgi:hypothetical protein